MGQQNVGTILVVDDQDAILELVEMVLSDYGYDVTTASNGLEALELLETTLFNLVISDINMPCMTGWELVHAIRVRPMGQSLPIIVMSADRRVPLTSADVDQRTVFLDKPFSIDALVQVVEHMLHL